MAYSGFLIKLGGSSGTVLPMEYISVGSYNSTPNQRMESKADRSVTGFMHRTTVDHTATKIEFETPNIDNKQLAELNALINGNMSNVHQRNITLYYYDQETDSYRTGNFYMPDVKYNIDHIETAINTIIYKPVRYAFIEY